MVTVLHGENIVQSRQRLQEFLRLAKTQGKTCQTFEASQLSRAKVEELLQRSSLFTEEEMLVFEGVLSLPKSKEKDAIINLICNAQKPIVCWESKSLSKTALKLFSQAKVVEFPIASQLWKFLDQVSPDKGKKTELLKNLQQICATEAPELVFAMLQRQVRLLLKVSSQQTAGLAPFMVSKLQRQLQKFTLSKLLELHSQLYEIDQKIKTSGSHLTLQQQLDLLLIRL